MSAAFGQEIVRVTGKGAGGLLCIFPPPKSTECIQPYAMPSFPSVQFTLWLISSLGKLSGVQPDLPGFCANALRTFRQLPGSFSEILVQLATFMGQRSPLAVLEE